MQNKLIEAHEEGKHSAAVLWDLSAAFDTVKYSVFLKELEVYGFSEKSVRWFKSYLEGRKQVVQVGNSFSGEITITVGTPQRAVLSPIIFFDLWGRH